MLITFHRTDDQVHVVWLVNSIKNLRKNYIFCNFLQKIEEGTVSNSFNEDSITLIIKPSKAIIKKEKYRPIPYLHWCKNPQQNISKSNQAKYKIYTPQPSGTYFRYVSLVQLPKIKWCYLSHHRLKKKNQITILIDAEKSFDTIPNHS